MNAELRQQLEWSLEYPDVAPKHIDGRYRAYERSEGGFVVCAFFRVGGQLMRATHGLERPKGNFVVIYTEREDAEAKATRLNARLQGGE